ncbi:AraC-like DNA-binding protein [Paucibacter oligotrophus]|uniref:AraC-like DNA-binding protein n=1 Tax=Roseateles oligotrophus TaxID=1769250 RepID=A0A840LAR2_9BURK|nr:helix-turn-helix domain-containing protein [Roseateles oligotrophus]MBB4844831.1 AraC-like DNA-binding protein [Roseateles oligotrophus]
MDSAFLQWSATSPQAGKTLVLPDGCHDLILRVPAAGRPHWLAVALMDRAEWVHSQAGEQFLGFRLMPWAQVDKTAIVNALQQRSCPDPAEAKALIVSGLRLDHRLAEALQALAQAPSVSQACRDLGVAERSLQRLVSGQTGRTPSYWRSLARLRRSARALQGQALLPWSELAAQQGYADQAHLCREFRRWLGCTPQQFRARPDWLAQACAPGFEG